MKKGKVIALSVIGLLLLTAIAVPAYFTLFTTHPLGLRSYENEYENFQDFVHDENKLRINSKKYMNYDGREKETLIFNVDSDLYDTKYKIDGLCCCCSYKVVFHVHPKNCTEMTSLHPKAEIKKDNELACKVIFRGKKEDISEPINTDLLKRDYYEQNQDNHDSFNLYYKEKLVLCMSYVDNTLSNDEKEKINQHVINSCLNSLNV